jgi:ABC-type uncharacterized transport system substrate-binding protein
LDLEGLHHLIFVELHSARGDAKGSGDLLAHPGGNVTGLTNLGRELGGKRLELFKEAVPKVARVAVLTIPFRAAYTR